MRALLTTVIALVAFAPAAEALKTTPPKPKKPKSHLYLWMVRTTDITMHVDFHGDREGTCAEHGLCDTSGTLDLRIPKGVGALVGIAEGGAEVFVGVLRHPVLTSTSTTAGASETCTDRVTPASAYFGVRRNPTATFVFGAPGSGIDEIADPYPTRCAGPNIRDLLPGLPVANVAGFLRMHRFKVVLDQSQVFHGGAFAGTITATGTLRFTKF